MLIDFSVENFLSFKEKMTFSMVASKEDNLPQNVKNNARGTGYNLLKSAVLYGANASGKSNFVEAIRFMGGFVARSSKADSDADIHVTPFKLDRNYKNKPSSFEISFLADGVHYRYGFVVNPKMVLEEWLYSFPKGQPRLLFSRKQKAEKTKPEFKFNKTHFPGKKILLESMTSQNMLFISVAAQFNNEVANKVRQWFSKCLYVVSSDIPPVFLGGSLKELQKNNQKKNKSLEFLKKADLGIADFDIVINKMDKKTYERTREIFKIVLSDEKNMEEALKTFTDEKIDTELFHAGVDEKGNSVMEQFNIHEESSGTVKMFNMSGIWNTILSQGCVLISDEFDLGLHPILSKWLIKRFNDRKLNAKGAQIVFTTHNTEFLDKKMFRRDQIWFTEKKHRTGATDLYSLADIKKTRSEENHKKLYLEGVYGGVPIMEDDA